MKTNVDNNSPQEAPLKSKSKHINKNEKNNSYRSKEEKEKNDEKKSNKDKDKNIENNNNKIILEKNCEDNKDNKDNKEKNINKNNNDGNQINIDVKVAVEEDPLVAYMQSNLKISEEEINNSSTLILEEIDGNLFNGNVIEINAGGMVGGRNKNDGFTIFGNKNAVNLNEKKNDVDKNVNNDAFMPDFELNILNDAKYLLYPYIFTIYYKKEDKSYYIRAYSGKGSDNKILFIKL